MTKVAFYQSKKKMHFLCRHFLTIMKNFLKRVQLLVQLTTELDGIHKNEFVDRLKKEVDPSDLGIFEDMFDGFSSSKNEYKGRVSYEGFKIKRKKRFFDMNMNLSIASGSFTQKEDKLIITTEINGFRKSMIPFYVFVIFIYIVTFITFLFTMEAGNGISFIVLPFILVHAALMMGIPYLFMRRSTSRMKRELEREFHYIAKK